MAFYLMNYSCTHPSKQEKFCFVRTQKGIFNFILFDLTKSHYFLRASKGVRASVKSAVNIYLNTAFSLMNASVQKIIIPYLIKILGKYQFWKLLHDLSSYCLNVPLAFWEIRLHVLYNQGHYLDLVIYCTITVESIKP